jgi:hypothetical protein
VVFVLRIRGDDTLDGRSTSSEEEAAEEGEDDLDEATVLVGAAAAIERRTMQVRPRARRRPTAAQHTPPSLAAALAGQAMQ